MIPTPLKLEQAKQNLNSFDDALFNKIIATTLVAGNIPDIFSSTVTIQDYVKLDFSQIRPGGGGMAVYSGNVTCSQPGQGGIQLNTDDVTINFFRNRLMNSAAFRARYLFSPVKSAGNIFY